MPSSVVIDKQMFFQDVTLSSIEDVKKRAKKKFGFLTTHRGSITHEFDERYAVMTAGGINSEASWIYCYYTASMLKNYYNAYSPACANAIHYSEICDEIEKQINNKPAIIPEKETLLETLAHDLSALMTVPFSNAKLRTWDGKANMQRLSTRFSMITVQQSLLLANQYHYLDGLERLMGRQVNIAVLSAPLGVYNALSVGLFGFRFLLNLSMLLKHTFIPSPSENLTMDLRFYEEIKKRHFQMTNDFVWGIINGLSNYAAYFHIASPVANYLLIGFSAFDVVWLTYLLIQTDKNYNSQKDNYFEYKKTLTAGSEEDLIVDAQLDKLELAHEKARSEVVFYIAAASILLGSFTAVFLLSPPALVPVCFLVCNVAIAMYLSGDKYGVYKEKCLVVKQQEKKGLDVATVAMKDVENAWNNLGFTVAKNTVMPLVIMTAFTVSLPAAILLTLSYVAYECGYLTRLPELFSGMNKSEEPEMVAPRLGSRPN